jgi:hypothetical protein
MANATQPFARHAVGLCLAMALLPSARTEACEKKPAQKSPLKISVVAILASETSTRVDSELRDIAAEIRRVHPELTGFRRAKMTCKSVEVRGTESFDLVANQTADVTVMKEVDKDNWVQLKVIPPTLGEITYTTICGKFFPIVTQHKTNAREWLIIAVRVQPCDGKK